MSALMMAATYSKPEVVELLLRNGADESLRDQNKKRAFDKAKDKKIKYLLSTAAVERRLKVTFSKEEEDNPNQ